MRKFISVIVVVILFVSCHKNDTNEDAFNILTQHVWFPYQVEIITDDTIIASSHDNNGTIHTNTQIIKLDTTVIFDQCLSSVSYKFQSNGRLLITNPCNTAISSFDTSWSLQQNTYLTSISINYPGIGIYYMNHFTVLPPADNTYSYWLTKGRITSIRNNQFVYNNNFITGTFDLNTFYGDTINKISSKQFTTYKTR